MQNGKCANIPRYVFVSDGLIQIVKAKQIYEKK